MARSATGRKVRRSTRGRWRAAALVGLHLLIAAHVTHYLVAGSTLSPVEPSESMYTLELGYLNAGFVFFAVALLLTLVFGRFICGWACHIVAIQDLCGWVMTKLGVRPRPFRSRLLALGPMLLALYMFVWPTVKRAAAPAFTLAWPGALEELRVWLFAGTPAGFPGVTNHLMTDSFWKTFPGPVFAVLTLVTCGVAAVWFLGNKGFCTYGCPYGAFFGVADRLAPARIRVTDACHQCGHCTATCTSNVRVHEEVAAYGMVVDPGCMKCTDCVSVCPTGALYYGFGRPALMKGKARRTRAPSSTLGLPVELALAGVALGTTLAFRGLYDGPPLLMSVALGALTAYVALKLWQLARHPTVRLQKTVIKAGGRWTLGGRVFAGLAAVWLVFAAHSAFVQWHRTLGAHWLERTQATRAQVLDGSFRSRSYSELHERAMERAGSHFATADAWGLVAVPEIKLGRAWVALLRGQDDGALQRLREAVALSPDQPAQHDNLIEVALSRGRTDVAIAALQHKLRRFEPGAEDHFRLAGLLVERGRTDGALHHYRACLELAPDSALTRFNLGGLLRRLGRPAEAVEQLAAARRLAPDDYDTLVELGLSHMAAGDEGQALEALREAVLLDPQRAESRAYLQTLIHRLERPSETGAGPRS